MGNNNKLFSVDEKVKVIANTCWHEFEIGTICRIESVNEVNYTVSDGSDYWYMLDEELESAKES